MAGMTINIPQALLRTAVLLPVLTAGACSESEDDVDLEERLAIVAEANGFDVSDAVFEDGRLIVDDVEFGSEDLDEYDVIISGVEHRAYLQNENTKVVSAQFRDICFEIDNAGNDSAIDWWATFGTLSSDINALNSTLSTIRRTKSTGCPSGFDVIHVSSENLSGNTLGRADFPDYNTFTGKTRPGDTIKLDRGRSPSLRVAAHEFMHTVGFTHIDANNPGDWVPGTCASPIGCATIMFSTGSPDQQGFRADDTAAMEIVY